MKQQLLLLTAIASIFFISCQKEETNDLDKIVCNFPDRLSKVISYEFSPNQAAQTTSYLMSYDENGNLTKRQLKGSNATTYSDYDYFEYDAQGNCIKHEWKTYTGAPSRYYEYDYLDNRRTTTRFFTSISPNAPIILMQTTTFFYNGNQLEKIENDQPQFGNPPSIGTFSYSNDNKKIQLDYQASGGNLETTVYHYSNLANPTAIPELQFGYPDNSLLLDSITYNNAPTTSNDFQYQIDDMGRVTAKIAYVVSLGEYTIIERYYYNCQE